MPPPLLSLVVRLQFCGVPIMIAFACPGCRKSLKVKEEFAGRSTRCPACKAQLVVPAPVSPLLKGSPPALADSSELTWQPGDRVLAHWPKEVSWWYAGKVHEAHADRILVEFDDGDQCWLTPDQVKPINIAVGSRVFGRWKQGGTFFPGTVSVVQDDNLHIQFDDGDSEWTRLKWVRVDRGAPLSLAASSGHSFQELGSSSPSGTVRPRDEWAAARKLLKTWWPLGAALAFLLAAWIFVSLDSSESVSSPEEAYNAGYTWGSAIKQKGVAAATKTYSGTKNHPDFPLYQKNPSYRAAFHHGLGHGLEGAPRKYLSIYGIP